MLYCLYENTHTCLFKRESVTLVDGSSTKAGTTHAFALLVQVRDFSKFCD